MVSIGQHIHVVDTQNLLPIAGDVINSYYFEVISVSGTPVLNDMGEAIIEAWYSDYILPVRNIQSNAIGYQNLFMEVVEEWETEFWTGSSPTPITGLVAGEYLARQTAYSFQWVRRLKVTRNGSKRYAGVPESAVQNNALVAPFTTYVADAAERLGDALSVDDEEGNGFTARPVIAKTPTPPATRPSVYGLINGVQFRGMGSQNTRKKLL